MERKMKGALEQKKKVDALHQLGWNRGQLRPFPGNGVYLFLGG